MSETLNRAVRNASRMSALTLRTGKHRRIIQKFGEKIGLIYFGFVDQYSDDHKVIGGFTASSSHHDNHYSVGSVGGYSITLLERTDGIWQEDNSVKIYNWLILAIDIDTSQELPRFFLKANNHNEDSYRSMFLTSPTLKEVELGAFEAYGVDFTSRFTFYSNPSDSIQLQRLFPADTTRVIGAHFWPLSVEVKGKTLYIYADATNLSSGLLDTVLENGLWLAGHISNRIENI